MNLNKLFEKIYFSPAPETILGFGIVAGLYTCYKLGRRVNTENATNAAAKSFIKYAQETEPDEVVRTVKKAASKDISLDKNVNALRNAVNAYKDIAAAVVISGIAITAGYKLLKKRENTLRVKLKRSRINFGQMRNGIDGMHSLMCNLTNSIESIYSVIPGPMSDHYSYFDGIKYASEVSRRMVEHSIMTAEECYCPWNKHETINA